MMMPITNCPTGDTGVVFQRSTVSISQITDGTSYTYLFGEKNLDPNYYDGQPVFDVSGNEKMARNDDQSMYNGHDRDNVRSTFVGVINGVVSPQFSYLPMPDTPGQAFGEWSFGGPHSGGWQVVFCDGSVHFLSYEMEPMNHRWFGNRQDGNVVDKSEF
jgi:prepilin-type processing-associated H-X9-DG protein